MSRRSFVGGGVALTALGIGFAGVEGASALLAQLAGPGPGLVRSRFEPLVGARLQMRAGAHSVPVRLLNVRDLVPAGTAHSEHEFSLLFQAASAIDWPQQTYQFQSAGLGRVSLFAVPMGSSGGRTAYEVVVNDPFAAAAAKRRAAAGAA